MRNAGLEETQAGIKTAGRNSNNLRYGLPWWLRWLSVCLQCGRPGFDPWVGKIPWRRKWQSTPGLLPGKSHGQRSLVGYSPWGRKELDTTERLHFTSKEEVMYLQSIQIQKITQKDATFIKQFGKRTPEEWGNKKARRGCTFLAYRTDI